MGSSANVLRTGLRPFLPRPFLPLCFAALTPKRLGGGLIGPAALSPGLQDQAGGALSVAKKGWSPQGGGHSRS